jgi:NAD(P)H-dependent flavin oxidoreductase YrpB (nitropropane dioxygenase family)
MSAPQIFERLGMTVPIFQAPIGAIASVELAAAISEAGGLGHLACTWRSPDQLRDLFRAMQLLTKQSFGANFVVDFPIDERLGVALDYGVRVISFFWGDGSPYLSRVKAMDAIAIQVVDFTTIESPYRFTLMCPHDQIEKAMSARLQGLGGRALRPCRLLHSARPRMASRRMLRTKRRCGPSGQNGLLDAMA